MISKEVARALNIGWKRDNWMVITGDGNQSALSKVVESVHINVHGMGISISIFLSESGSESVILRRPIETYARKCERNLANGSCGITILAVDG